MLSLISIYMECKLLQKKRQHILVVSIKTSTTVWVAFREMNYLLPNQNWDFSSSINEASYGHVLVPAINWPSHFILFMQPALFTPSCCLFIVGASRWETRSFPPILVAALSGSGYWWIQSPSWNTHLMGRQSITGQNTRMFRPRSNLAWPVHLLAVMFLWHGRKPVTRQMSGNQFEYKKTLIK